MTDDERSPTVGRRQLRQGMFVNGRIVVAMIAQDECGFGRLVSQDGFAHRDGKTVAPIDYTGGFGCGKKWTSVSGDGRCNVATSKRVEDV